MTTVDALPQSPAPVDLARTGAAVRDLLAGTRARRTAMQLARASPAHRVGAIMAFLMTGIAIAIATTPDPSWWRLHFSELGTFRAFSSYVFNGTLLCSGVAIVFFSRFLHRELTLHVARSGSRRRSPLVLSSLIGSVGVHLAFVGAIPVNTWTFMHDRAATGMVFSFLICLIVAPSMLRGLARPLAATTLPAVGLLLGGGTSMIFGIINLAAFELIGFATMFTWMLLFVAFLGKHARNTAARTEGGAQSERAAWGEYAGDAAPRRRVRLRATRADSPLSSHVSIGSIGVTPLHSAEQLLATLSMHDHPTHRCGVHGCRANVAATPRFDWIARTHVIGAATRSTPARKMRPRSRNAGSARYRAAVNA